MAARLILIALIATLASCATAPMSRDQCGASSQCHLSGTLTPVNVQGVDMGRMDLADGQCVAISLPDHMLDRLFSGGAHQTSISGRVFDDPGPERNVTQIIVNGRDVGSGLCGGRFFVFVY